MNPTRLVSDPDGGHFEIQIMVDDTLTWRQAQWEYVELCRLYSERYGMRVYDTQELRPILAPNERLVQTNDGDLFIKTIP